MYRNKNETRRNIQIKHLKHFKEVWQQKKINIIKKKKKKKEVVAWDENSFYMKLIKRGG